MPYPCSAMEIVKPRVDPWQQKSLVHLKQHQSVDELLQMHCRFLQVSDPLRVMQTLQEHAARVSVTSNLTRESSAQIWMRIYSATHLSQDPSPEGTGEPGKGNPQRRNALKKQNPEGYSFVDSLQKLGVDDEQDGRGIDNTGSRGAYLSLLYLRHLRIRQLQRTCLGILNYLRSVERTLTFDTAGLQVEGGELASSAEETAWMNAARGGSSTTGGLGSHQYLYNTPADYKVHCAEFMEFSEVENLHDYYSSEKDCVHTQDARGLYIVYDVAIRDLEELEHTLLLVASLYIQKSIGHGTSQRSPESVMDLQFWAQMDVDRLAILLDLWTCEESFLQGKMQLLDCYFEAYQHVSDGGERLGLAQVITDVMHRRPRLDLSSGYFVGAYSAELRCMQSHQQLLRLVLNCQIDEQRHYLQRVWRDRPRGMEQDYGLPLNYFPKQLVSLSNSSPALKNVYLLEFHPSLCLASQLYQTLNQAHSELCQLHGTRAPSERLALEQRLLLRALQKWHSLAPPGASYSSQTQKDLFADVFFEDPFFVRGVGATVLSSEAEKRRGKERQLFIAETFSKLLELVTLRHRLMESASETAQLSQLYSGFAKEMGFEPFHLHMRPVQFEFAVHKEKLEKPPLFVTALLQDDSTVDRYTPSSLPLCIQEVDESQISRFSFRTEEAVLHLMGRSGIDNLQVALACQVTQKNALIGAVKQATLCYWAQYSGSAVEEVGLTSIAEVNSSGMDIRVHKDTNSQSLWTEHSSTRKTRRADPRAKIRPAEAFVAMQLEKVGPRDEMLNAFVKKKEVLGTMMKNPEEVEKVKRALILEFCHKYV